MSDIPKCTATTRAGQPCRARPLKDGSGLCRGHSLDEEGKRALNRAAADAKKARKAKADEIIARNEMSLRARLSVELEQQAEEITERLAKLALSSDDQVALRGIQLWLDRVHGRAVQTTQDLTPANPLQDVLASLTPEERRSLFVAVKDESIAEQGSS